MVQEAGAMKLGCPCGHEIHDSTDFLPYKGHILADQDLFDFIDGTVGKIQEVTKAFAPSRYTPTERAKRIDAIDYSAHTAILRYTRTIYQCLECGRVFIEDHHGELHIFLPAPGEPIAPALLSIEGDHWKGPLTGHWKTSSNNRASGHL